MVSKLSSSQRSLSSFAIVLAILCSILILCSAAEESKGTTIRQTKTNSIYETHDVIDLVVEKLWSKYNPSETYSYKQLPFCEAKGLTDTSLGEELTGSADSVISNYDIRFEGLCFFNISSIRSSTPHIHLH